VARYIPQDKLNTVYSNPTRCDSEGGLQVGGGMTEANAQEWLQAGASKVRSLLSLLVRLPPSSTL
jgi:hypothetical protein